MATVGMIDGEASSLSVRRIAPGKRRIRFSDLREYGQIIRVLAARDFKAKYKQSVLGVAWLIIQPAGLLIGLTIAFSHRVSHPGAGAVPYGLFAMTGLCIWSYFQAATVMGTSSLVSNYFLVKRTPCPRAAFPISALIATTPTLAVVTGATVITALATDHLSARVALLPVAVLWVLVFTGSVVASGSSTGVYFRDVMNVLPLILQIGVFVAPIGYAFSSLSGVERVLVELNPITGLIEAWRWMLVSGYRPEVTPVLIALGETGVVAIFGWWVFTRLEPTVADRI